MASRAGALASPFAGRALRARAPAALRLAAKGAPASALPPPPPPRPPPVAAHASLPPALAAAPRRAAVAPAPTAAAAPRKLITKKSGASAADLFSPPPRAAPAPKAKPAPAPAKGKAASAAAAAPAAGKGKGKEQQVLLGLKGNAQMLGMKGASAGETDIWKIRIQLMKPVTWIPLIWGVLCGAAASGQFEWTPRNVALSALCMLMSGPLLTGYTQVGAVVVICFI